MTHILGNLRLPRWPKATRETSGSDHFSWCIPAADSETTRSSLSPPVSGWTNLGQEYVLPGSIWWCYEALLLMPMVIHRLIQVMDYVGSTMGAAGCALWVLGDAIHRLNPSSLLLTYCLSLLESTRTTAAFDIVTNAGQNLPTKLRVSQQYLQPNTLPPTRFHCQHRPRPSTVCLVYTRGWALFYGLAATRFGFRIVEKLTGHFGIDKFECYTAGFTLLGSRARSHRFTAMGYRVFYPCSPLELVQFGRTWASTTLMCCSSSWSQEFINVTGPLHLTVVWNRSLELVVGMVPSDSWTIVWVCRVFAYLFWGSYWYLHSMLLLIQTVVVPFLFLLHLSL